MIYQTRWDTSATKNGTHTIRTKVTEPSGRTTYSTPVSVTVNNPEIDIIAQDEDAWDVNRRSNDSGKKNKLEVDKHVTVRINGVMR